MIETITKKYYIENIEWLHYRDISEGTIKLKEGYEIYIEIDEYLLYIKIRLWKIPRTPTGVRLSGIKLREYSIRLPDLVTKEAIKISYLNPYEKIIPEIYLDHLIGVINNLIIESKEDFLIYENKKNGGLLN